MHQSIIYVLHVVTNLLAASPVALRVLRYHQMTPGVPPNTSVEIVSITYPLISLIKGVRHPNEVFGGTLGDTWCQMYY